MTTDGRVRLEILEEFLDGRRPSVSSLAESLGADAREVTAAFERLAAGRAIVLAQGTHDILMAAPFSGVRTDHQVKTSTERYDANCIWDALGIPAMLAAAGRAADATITSRCEDCGAPLTLEVRAGRVTVEPEGVVAHFAVPAASWWQDIVFT